MVVANRIGVCALLLALVSCRGGGEVPSERARSIAETAQATYSDAMVATLADLVGFRTVHREGIANADNPEFQALTAYLERRAGEFGFDFADHGAVVVIGLGDADDRLGLVTHADVQPANPADWAQSPFSLDTLSEPGRLIGRGAEDDKGPIATALYAMKAVKDAALPLGRRIELIISYTEESDWQAFMDFLARSEPPGLNVVLDSEYPVVVAEKGWNSVHLVVPASDEERVGGENRLISFSGGAFLSQIPGDAEAVIADPTPEVQATLRAAAERDSAVRYSFASENGRLTVVATGSTAHSSKPEEGRNAIAHLAALLGAYDWPDGQVARMVRLINDLVGTGIYGERFGSVAATHPFMGPLTLALTTLGRENDALVAGINIRSPAGREPEELERLIHEAVDGWERRTGIALLETRVFVSPAHYPESAPHIPVLLDIFAHYTGDLDAQPIAIGGGTHARLVPNGVSFGPSMPGVAYTAHSEHEFIAREQMEVDLRMYTAMIVELAGR